MGRSAFRNREEVFHVKIERSEQFFPIKPSPKLLQRSARTGLRPSGTFKSDKPIARPAHARPIQVGEKGKEAEALRIALRNTLQEFKRLVKQIEYIETMYFYGEDEETIRVLLDPSRLLESIIASKTLVEYGAKKKALLIRFHDFLPHTFRSKEYQYVCKTLTHTLFSYVDLSRKMSTEHDVKYEEYALFATLYVKHSNLGFDPNNLPFEALVNALKGSLIPDDSAHYLKHLEVDILTAKEDSLDLLICDMADVSLYARRKITHGDQVQSCALG